MEREEAKRERVEDVREGEKEVGRGRRERREPCASDRPWVSRATVNVNK